MLSVRFSKGIGSLFLNAEFEANEGSITAIFGKSGAGKTSIIDAIAGLTLPDDGSIKLGETTLYLSHIHI